MEGREKDQINRGGDKIQGLPVERGVAAYKVPDRSEKADSFPRTPVGKISKKALAARVTD